MILFPIALIWVAVVLVVIIRKSTVDPELPEPEDRPPGRFRPRGPRRPDSPRSTRRETTRSR